MSISQTNGYHLALELSPARVGAIITRFLIEPLPFSIAGAITATASTIAGRPDQVTIQSGNNITVRAFRTVNITGIPVRPITLQVTIQANISVSPAGAIIITYPSAPVVVPEGAANVALLESLAGLASLATGTTMTSASLLATASSSILFVLQNITLPTIPMNVPLFRHTCSFSIREFTIRTINNSLFLLLQFSGAGFPTPATNPAAFSASLRGANESLVMIANEALLAIATCFASAEVLGGATFTGSGNCRNMVGTVTRTISGLTLLISNVSVCVVGNQVVLSGTASNSGTGYNATGSFRAPIGFNCSTGTIVPVFNNDDIETSINISFEWWVYLIGFGAAAVIGLILGPLTSLIATVVVALLSPIVSALVSAFVRSAIPGLTAGARAAVDAGYQLLPAELHNLLGDIQCDQVLLDDLALKGTLRNQVLPNIGLTKRVNSTRSGEPVTGYDPVLGDYREYHVSNQVIFTGTPYRFMGSARYSWMVNRSLLRGASGNIIISGNNISYSISGNVLRLNIPTGVNCSAEVLCKATGADNQSRVIIKVFKVQGTKREYDDIRKFEPYNYFDIWAIPLRLFVKPIPDPGDPDPLSIIDMIRIQDLEFRMALAGGMQLPRIIDERF